jgi:hypothetical protein
MDTSKRQGGALPKVEITPEMLDAGIYALSLCDPPFDLSEQIVSSVFRAMVLAGDYRLDSRCRPSGR